MRDESPALTWAGSDPVTALETGGKEGEGGTDRQRKPANTRLVALHHWRGRPVPQGLNIQIGDSFSLLEVDESGTWYLVQDLKKKKVGVVPSSYVTPVQEPLPITQEAKEVTRLWGRIYKQMFIIRDSSKLQTLERAISDMIWWRHQLASDSLTQEEAKDLQKKMAGKIDSVNSNFDLESVARTEEGRRLQTEDGCVTLYNAYTRTLTRGRRSGRAVKRGEDARQNLTNHHLQVVLTEVGGTTWLEDIVIYCQLYSDRRPGYVSERWCVSVNKARPQAVFLDLGSFDQCIDLHLVVQVHRLGRILHQEGGGGGGKQGTKRYSGIRSLTGQVGPLHKRPLSGGTASIQHLFHTESKTSATSGPGSVEVRLSTCDEKDFHHLHELLLKNSTRTSHTQTTGPTFLTFQLQVLSGNAQQCRTDQPLVFKEAVEARRLGFPPVIMPGDLRNDLYLTLERGQFERGGKPGMSGRNVEVRIGVFDADGQEIEDGVVCAAGGGPAHPVVYYHNNSPCWGETFRLQIPIDLFRAERCHLRLEYSHCSVKEKQEKKLFGFSWLRLMREDSTVIVDGVHELPVFKCDAQDRLIPSCYLPPPDSPDPYPDPPSYPRSTKESVTVHTLLCSTKLTQNLDLMALLKWRSHPDRIPEILGRIMKTGGEEIVKFLQDVLDALFAMFSTEDGNSTSHSGLVFHVLVHILAFLQEPKFEHFQAVIDAYLRDHFAAALVYKGLLSCVKHCAEMVPSTVKQDPIRKCFQSLNYVFKFIVASRQLFSRATGGQNEDSFRYEVHLLFNSFNKMLSYQSEQVLPTQVVFLNNLASIYPTLIQVLPVVDIAKLVTLTLDSLGQERSQYLHRAALGAARATVTSPLWEEERSRGLLLSPCLALVSQHLQHRREVDTSTAFLLEIVHTLNQTEDDSCNEDSAWWRDVTTLAEISLGPLGVAVIAEQEGEEEGSQAGLTAALVGILELLTPKHHVLLWRTDTAVLGRLFLVLTEVISRPAFPSEWQSLRLALSRTVSRTIRLAGDSLNSLTFDKQLWMGYFRLAVCFITSPLVQLEVMKRQGRYFLGMDTTEDLRVPMASHMVSMWEMCPHQIQLVPSLVGPLLEVTLLPLREVRQTILPLMMSMMEAEQNHRGNFRQMETELIDKLDILINENKGDEEYRQIFNSLMQDLVQHLDPTWQESGQTFVSSVTRLLERLLDYRDVLQGDENRNKRMSCTVNLLKFYRDDINRQEMYIRYIYKLHDLHLSVGNHAEAGFTLLLHANLLDWNTRMLHSDLQFPTQQEWQRKEQLYLQIIQLFDTAQLWEFATPLCKELSDLYEKRIYDYSKLSGVLRLQADFFTKIISQFRPEPEYFRVGFYGLSFPLFVRNKEFIYRGQEFEKIGEFTQRLSKEFPEAKICAKLSASVEELREEEGQNIQIVSVKPEPQSVGDYMGPEVPDKIRDFYAVNRVSSFIFDRPFHRGTQDPNNEFKSLWIERTRIDSVSEFPGILKWFEVERKEVDHVHPVDFAAQTVKAKNMELKKFINEYTVDRDKNISPFTMRLQGNIDAAVNGGIAKYRAAFFTEEFIAENPSYYNALECLAALISEQARLLEDGLSLHGCLAPEAVQPLHARLIEVFSTMKGSMTQSILLPSPRSKKTSRILNTPLPPLPGDRDQKRKDSDTLSGSSLYGKFVGHTDQEEDIYCRPLDMTNSYHDILVESNTDKMLINNNNHADAYHDISDVILRKSQSPVQCARDSRSHNNSIISDRDRSHNNSVISGRDRSHNSGCDSSELDKISFKSSNSGEGQDPGLPPQEEPFPAYARSKKHREPAPPLPPRSCTLAAAVSNTSPRDDGSGSPLPPPSSCSSSTSSSQPPALPRRLSKRLVPTPPSQPASGPNGISDYLSPTSGRAVTGSSPPPPIHSRSPAHGSRVPPPLPPKAGPLPCEREPATSESVNI